MKLDSINRVYLLGIGGIGMSALARYFKRLGVEVAGYDKTKTPLTLELAKEGISINYLDEQAAIPRNFSILSEDLLVIYTPAIPKDAFQFNFFKNGGFNLKKRSEVLGEISKTKKVIAVAGTHGKTTVSAMIAHIFKHSGKGINAFLGGITTNYQTNYLFDETADWMVVEADEYDHSFLRLYPDVAVVTSLEPDHLDIHGNFEELRNDYERFLAKVVRGGRVLLNESVKDLKVSSDHTQYIYASNGNRYDFQATNIEVKNGRFCFDAVLPGTEEIKGINLVLPGLHNVENALVALAAGFLAGINKEELKRGIESFLGVKRRFERHPDCTSFVLVDDYAHHPGEIKATLNAARTLFPEKKILGIFQPHLFTRTRDLMDDFALSFNLLDELVLLPIYPAREKPIEGVSSEVLLAKVELQHKSVVPKEDVVKLLKEKTFDVLLVMGAGDIDQLITPIKETYCLNSVC